MGEPKLFDIQFNVLKEWQKPHYYRGETVGGWTTLQLGFLWFKFYVNLY